MSRFTSIAALIVVIVLSLLFYIETDSWASTYPEFDLHGKPKVSSIIYGSAFDPHSGDFQIIKRKDTINIPWTSYLPFYQHSTITASRTFDIFFNDYSRRDDSVTVTQEVTRIGVIPSFKRQQKVKEQLNKVFQDGIDARLQEHRKETEQGAAANP